MTLKLDLHVHSVSNGKTHIDCDQLKESLLKKGLHGVAITNFFDISHALLLKEQLKEFIIIVGQEVWTKDGHLIGLGLKERVTDFLSAEETIGHIHEQGGIAIAPHPYLFVSFCLGEKVTSLPVDAVEVYNGLAGGLIVPNFLAKRAARKMKVPQVASTDTTDVSAIGQSYTEILVENPNRILEAIRGGQVKLHKRALPLPFAFVFKGLFYSSNIAPCSVHSFPCLVCGKTMAVRMFKDKRPCLDCGKEEWTRIVCCTNEHFLCLECVVKRNLAMYLDSEFKVESERK
ncbi:MAG TPA: PHP-associated domain-containing protein [Candidatus Avalokitesvara rifleensis]|uniref:PHP-associated domain-containing protein n=1 Tax=Candidatus Avalokitesvara rifleensis TaxID=3367620 RepID=UPI0027127569|nr:PHP-associated domain-containing protein [Candidatus Brocadiales bacterium]